MAIEEKDVEFSNAIFNERLNSVDKRLAVLDSRIAAEKPKTEAIEYQAREYPGMMLRTWDEIRRAKALMTELNGEMRLMRACWPGKEWYEAHDKLSAENKELKAKIAGLRKVDG